MVMYDRIELSNRGDRWVPAFSSVLTDSKVLADNRVLADSWLYRPIAGCLSTVWCWKTVGAGRHPASNKLQK